MQVRRCAVVFMEPREEVGFDLRSLLAGGAGLRRQRRWLALAPHLDGEIEIDADERELLGQLSPGEWSAADAWPASTTQRLLEVGLLIGDAPAHAHHRERDQRLRDGHWWPAAAMLHRLARWDGVDGVADMEAKELTTVSGLRDKLGAPPPPVHERVPAAQRIGLPEIAPGEFDALLARRATCRNFDRERALPRELFAHMLVRSFAAQAQLQTHDDAAFLKKHSPSAGGLHATEAYLIVQRVEGVAPGLYHYHPVAHALEPLPSPPDLGAFALAAVAGQHWFADAPVLAVLAPRYARCFWKYRHHAKAYRALVLDSGHLSQTLYLSATELGLGAFVTCAINEVDIERGFALDPLEEGPLAVCGFGWRAADLRTAEFDPGGAVWAPAAG
ncbi:putative peptide maturation dehydrogenase [Lysobacter sp. 5GHs7-4]|uniref:putative peptide maturation dehydrogenase n=1 Tax=Lysobacter sp. 5GHs7-4 TaxID=2904253 RepID=UPI001E28C6E1|nr:putative peptide maturation dehydrogenase [Lysobacter sp. 5GHs7-4]UHQ23644.1 putative peptide maturation dehydrogenase [Lysobacter sp. 5GHs7-4]